MHYLQRGIGMVAKSNDGLHGSRRKTLLVVALVVIVVLIASLFAYRFLVVDNGPIRVKTATELKDAVNKAEIGVHIDIALTKDITLGPVLNIPGGANITLTSATKDGFFKLIGLDSQKVITVDGGAVLTLDTVYPKPAF
jgi:hypothetical protein